MQDLRLWALFFLLNNNQFTIYFFVLSSSLIISLIFFTSHENVLYKNKSPDLSSIHWTTVDFSSK